MTMSPGVVSLLCGAALFALASSALVLADTSASASMQNMPSMPSGAEANILSVESAPIASSVEISSLPPETSPLNIYSAIGAGNLSPVTAGALPRVYVPNHSGNSVSVIDTTTLKVVDTFKVGLHPQHVVPSWDLITLWVANNGRGRRHGSLTPIDPNTGKPGTSLPVQDPYNMYFLPDGSAAIVVDEALRKLDLRDPKTMALKAVIPAPSCRGINHADFSADGSYALFSCEYSGGLIKVNLNNQTILGTLSLPKMAMPQDIRLSPDGKLFYVADMMHDGVFLVDGDKLVNAGFIPTGVGAHGLTVSRDGTELYVSNRGTHRMSGAKKHGPGSVSVIDFAKQDVVSQWPIPGGGSPDMGNVSADGKQLWLSGRFDNEVYMFDTTSGAVTKIPVGMEPHGLTVWPQPGRYSQGHTGNMR